MVTITPVSSRFVGGHVERCTDRAPHRLRAAPTLTSWTITRKYATSSCPDERRSPRTRSACRPAATGVCPGCDAARSPRSPGSASSTTPSSNAAPSTAPPTQVLDAIARALQLDDAEREHLNDLARTADSTTTRRRARRSPLESTTRPSLQWALDAVTAGPAFVRNGRMDILAANRLARAFYTDAYADPRRPPNIARFTFLDPAGERFYPDWDSAADICVAILRTEAGRNPHDRLLHDLVGELSTRSDDFRTRWGRHDVRHHGTGTKRFHHPVVGELTLAYEGLEMAAEPGLTLTIYTAEPGSPSAERLQVLGSWAATPGNDPAAPPPPRAS